VNHLSHYLLTNLIVGYNVLDPFARIINVSSDVHVSGHVNFDDIQGRKVDRFQQYANTKLQNVLFTRALDREFRAKRTMMRSLSVHPGTCDTDFVDHFIPKWMHAIVRPLLRSTVCITAEQGAESVLYAACAEELRGVGGQYIDACRVVRSSPESRDRNIEQQLMQLSATMTGLSAPQ